MHGPDDDGGRAGDAPRPDDAPYTVYGAGRRSPRRAVPRGGDDRPRPGRSDGDRASASGGGAAGGAGASAGAGGDPPYTVYRAAPRLGRRGGGAPPRPDEQDPAGPRRPRRPIGRRILRWGLTFVAGWIALSLVLFVLSATVHQQGGKADALLGGGGAPFSPTTVLVLGTDARPADSQEPGAEGGKGSARTDTMMLLRTGGFANAKLSIPRDTLVEIPGHGRQKINAAYAFDGVRGAVRAVETLTGIQVNHVATMDFANFPQLVDAMGGVRYTAKTCLTADVSGGAARPRSGVTIGYDKHLGGTSFRLRKGRTYTLEGSAALALARVRKNRCAAGQDDTNRAQRQQQVLGAMKRRVLSPTGFLRMPLIAWKAPQAVQTDMAGFSMLGVAIGQFLPGGGSQAVLKPSGVGLADDGGQGLIVSPADVARARARFDR